MTEKMIIDAYCRIREIDNSIPDDVLEFMKNSALEKLRNGNNTDWDKFAEALYQKHGESLVDADDADEDNPYDYWLQDVTVTDIVEFCKDYN